MSVSVTTTLRREQWTLVALLFRRTRSGVSRDAKSMLTFADAAIDDLVELVDASLVRAVWAHDQAPVGRLAGVSAAELGRVRLDLTPAGTRWFLFNPHNRVLHAVTGRSLPLATAVRTRDLDVAAVAECIVAGLVQVIDVIDHRPVAATVPALRAAMAARPDTVWLDLTPYGARVVYR